MQSVFSDDEIQVVQREYPNLERIDPRTIEGTLKIYAKYGEHTIQDDFKIRITSINPYSNVIPALYEIGQRTEAIAQKYHISDLRTLHRNPNRTACVCVKQEEKRKFPPESDLTIYIEALAVPYLYGLSFYDKHGRWPWQDSSHGGLGLLEFNSDDTSLLSIEDIAEILRAFRLEPKPIWKEYSKQIRKPSSDRPCLCKSGKPFGSCHRKAHTGLVLLHKRMLHLGLKPKSFFSKATNGFKGYLFASTPA